MLKKLFPNKILSLNYYFFKILIFSTLVVILTGLIFSLFISPPDYIQGDSVRIMYVHVPASFLALGTFAIIGFISLIFLIFKIKILPLVGKSLAPLGLIFTLVSIVTGSLWGKTTWGAWWVWDARLTSMLVLFFFYILYTVSWKFFNEYNKAAITSSIIAILGSFNLPVIKYSVVWWSTLHQPSSITLTSAPTIHYTMLIPLVIMIIGVILYCLVVFLMKYKTEIIKYKINNNDRE